MNHQPQITVRATVLTGRATAFQPDALAVAYTCWNFHIQRFGDLSLYRAKRIVDRQGVTDGAAMLSKGFFEEHGHIDFDIVPTTGVALLRLASVLTKNGGENIVKIFGVVALTFTLLELTAELRIVAVLPQLIVFGTTLFIA